MARFSFQPGSETIDDFFWWINERHRIWMKRQAGEPKPWTKDPVLQEFKFTNVFRELDRGTIALRDMVQTGLGFSLDQPCVVPLTLIDHDDAPLLAWNIIWYRLFNWHEHATDPGYCDWPSRLEERLRRKKIYGEKIFTAAHMTVGKRGISKVEYVLDSVRKIFEAKEEVAEMCAETNCLYDLWLRLQKFICVGEFIGYEIVTDFRFYDCLLGRAKDIDFWVNIGPGCKRGLRRLGMAENVRSVDALWRMSTDCLEPHVLSHHPRYARAKGIEPVWPRFEMREIEHALCEFDKWCRTSHGEGRPRERFNGAGTT